MKITLVAIVLISLFFFSPLQAQSYSLKNRIGQTQRIDVRKNCITQRDRLGRIENTYKVQGNKIYQYNSKGVRK